jgi:predicted TIM-barrel fold metal-dependent hydrolase
LHFDAKDLLEYESVLDEIPLPVIIDHMGRVPVVDGLDQAPFKSLLSKLRDSEDLWVKVSGAERLSATGPPFSDAVPFASACIEAAPDRVIWGTDWPHPNVKTMPNDGDLVDLIPQMAPTIELQQQLLVDNPARLFGF